MTDWLDELDEMELRQLTSSEYDDYTGLFVDHARELIDAMKRVRSIGKKGVVITQTEWEEFLQHDIAKEELEAKNKQLSKALADSFKYNKSVLIARDKLIKMSIKKAKEIERLREILCRHCKCEANHEQPCHCTNNE